MNAVEVSNPCWYNALSLTERIASLRGVSGPVHDHAATDSGERRFERWRSQPPFTSGDLFSRRLATDNTNEGDFRHLLAEPIEAARDRLQAVPSWLSDLHEAFSHTAVSSQPVKNQDGTSSAPLANYVSAIEPLIAWGRELLIQDLQPLLEQQSDLPVDSNTVVEILLAGLPFYLNDMLSRTMVLELHVARLEGLLQGDTSEERFASFLRRVAHRDSALAILHEYPVLARSLAESVLVWVTASVEFACRLCADWDVIRSAFAPGYNPGVLAAVEGGAGDRHRGGRCVLIGRFTSGFQVVYKPRSLAIDTHFQQLLTWLNERGQYPPFRTLGLLNRETHGWMEFVSAHPCSSTESVRRFYERQGAYLALLYALEATDFHSENLFAAGEDPLLLDLEALFHPRFHGADERHADELAAVTLAYSAQGVGLLPMRIWSNAEGEGIDLSGLGAAAGQLSPNAVPHWESAGTDEMHLTRQRRLFLGDRNQPLLDSNPVNVLGYSDAITDGFTNMYRMLLRHVDELLAPDGPIDCFAQDEVRVLLRNTRTYSLLQYEAFHPDVLRDALDRERLFDRLWVAVEYRPYLASVIHAEREDLWRGDIPMFTTRPSSRDLWTSSDKRIPDFINEPGLSLVKRRFQRLGDSDLEQQLWVIRASLATLSAKGHGVPTGKSEPPPTCGAPDREQLIAHARAIGDRLECLAVRGEDDVSWIGLEFRNERQWSVVPLEIDLYDGLSGIGLFLARLGSITGNERYTSLARAALATMRRQIRNSQSLITSIGGFAGWGGVIYTMTHLAVLWKETALLAEADDIVVRLPDLIGGDDNSDVIDGAAGCIASLLGLHRHAPSSRTLAAMIQCGDRLLATAQMAQQGIGWPSKHAGGKPLAGMSHGAAGIAWPLLELHALTGAKRFKAGAIGALEYERSLYSPGAMNWPDLRIGGTSAESAVDREARFMCAWCHGASGIGLARLRALSHLDDPPIRMEIDAALNTTVAAGFGHNHSLCHGDFGNLELILQASETPGFANWRPDVDHIAGMIMGSMERDGWRCGNPLTIESPGLMTGLAGIGYGLLRLAEPARVPSVLSLAPPSSVS